MKQKLVISCPASSRSGYGDHARDIVNSLLNIDKFNIDIFDVRWGDTPRNALKSEIPSIKFIGRSQFINYIQEENRYGFELLASASDYYNYEDLLFLN